MSPSNLSILRTTTRSASRLLQKSPSYINTRNFHATSANMTVHNLKTTEDFKKALAENKLVLLDCFATWCGPCKAVAPIVEKHSEDEKFKDVYFAKIDVDEVPDVAQELGIRAMPTFIAFKDGDKHDTLMGANPPGIAKLLEAVIAA